MPLSYVWVWACFLGLSGLLAASPSLRPDTVRTVGAACAAITTAVGAIVTLYALAR